MDKRSLYQKNTCIFCGKDIDKEGGVTHINGSICVDCIEKFHYIVSAQKVQDSHPFEFGLKDLPTPRQFKKYLDKYIISQERAKKTISVSVYNHYKRLLMKKDKGINLEKSNILLIGPTGTGKTLIARTMSRFLNVPFAIADATPLTEAGYVGEDVENILLRLLESAGMDVKRAETGIIYIDEIDKIARKTDSPSITRDVSGEGVQQTLLKIIEGTVANVPPHGGRKHPEQKYIKMDTSHILFILGGTFDGLEDIIMRRLKKNKIGFKSVLGEVKKLSRAEIISMVEPEDLIKYGFIPELVGRIPVISTLKPLGEETLLKILTEPENSIVEQYRHFFEIEGIKLTITDEALRKVVKKAIDRGTGARGLRSIFEESMLDIMFELPEKKDYSECIITPGVIEKNEEPIFLRKLPKAS